MVSASDACFLQIENFDQTTSTALEHWDDHEDLTHYDFDTDGVQAPDNDDDKRKLAYRYSVGTLNAAMLVVCCKFSCLLCPSQVWLSVSCSTRFHHLILIVTFICDSKDTAGPI